MNEADFGKLTQSIRQVGRIKRGSLKPTRIKNISPADVRAIRIRLKKSQSEFALMIGVSVATLQNWEQGRRKPEGPARALLRIAEQNPKAVAEALGA
jgi:putative transcriptional regulator